VQWSRKIRAIPLLPIEPYGLYRASVPVQWWTLHYLIRYGTSWRGHRKIYLLSFPSHSEIQKRNMRTGQKYSVESRNLQPERPNFQSHSVTSQFSLIMVTSLDTVVWNRTNYALTWTWQLTNQCATWRVCCRSHRHVRLRTQLLSCLLALTNKTCAPDTIICTSCRQNTFIPMILHIFPAFCDFRFSHIGAAGYLSVIW